MARECPGVAELYPLSCGILQGFADHPGPSTSDGSLCAGFRPGHPALETYKEAKERFMEEFTRSYIHRLLEETTGNISLAARMSGLERALYKK